MLDVLEFGTGIAVLHAAFMVRVARATVTFLKVVPTAPVAERIHRRVD
jgi:hypothetical protein